MNTTIQENFQICISVPLKVAGIKKQGIKKQGISYNRQEKNDGLISSIKFNEFVVVLTWKNDFTLPQIIGKINQVMLLLRLFFTLSKNRVLSIG